MTTANKAELREKLAAIEHERWADWQKWVHAQMTPVSHGHLLHHDIYQRWQRQIRTPYADLTDKEKASDMEQVDRYWPLIEALLEDVEREARIDELRQFSRFDLTDKGMKLLLARNKALQDELWGRQHND